MYAKRFDVATGAWDAEPTLVSDGVARSEIASVGVDAHGNAIVVYDQSSANSYILVMGARYAASSGRWSEPTPLTETGTYYDSPLLSVAANGVAGLLVSSTQNESRPGSQTTSGTYRLFK